MTTEICHQPVKLHDIAWRRSAVMKYIITVAVAFFVLPLMERQRRWAA